MADSAPAPALAPNLYRNTRCGSLRPADIGSTVRLAGWVAAKRDHGGLLFIDLRDPAGPDADLPAPGNPFLRGDHSSRMVQLVSHPGHGAFETLSRLRLESVVAVTGKVVARPADTVNPKLVTGEVEVDVDGLEVLSTAEVLPFPVERDSDVGEEARLTHRYLDMRRGPLIERLAKRARFCQLVRSHLSSRGFLEVQTPVLTVSSPEGARDYLVPSRLYPGEFYALPQAPQQFKQLLMVGGVERYFQIAPCFRDEASRADRSPGEFYQIDLEMAFATQEDVFHEVELLFHLLVSSLSTKKAPSPYPRLSYADAMARYGTDKPDLRFGLEIVDITGALGGRTELPMFAEAPGRGNVVRALLAPAAADRPRSWFDSFGDAAKALGTIGSWLQLPADGSEYKGPCRASSRRKKWVPSWPPPEPGTVTPCSPASGPRHRPASPSAKPGAPSAATSAWPTRTSSPFAGSSIFPCSSATPRRAHGISPTTRSPCPKEACGHWRTTTRARSWPTSTTWCATGSSFRPGPSATTCPR